MTKYFDLFEGDSFRYDGKDYVKTEWLNGEVYACSYEDGKMIVIDNDTAVTPLRIADIEEDVSEEPSHIYLLPEGAIIEYNNNLYIKTDITGPEISSFCCQFQPGLIKLIEGYEDVYPVECKITFNEM